MTRTSKRKILSDSDSISFISLASIPENRRRKSWRFQLICYTVAIIIVFTSLVLSLTLPFIFKYTKATNSLPPNQACIPCGIIEGRQTEGIIEFLGIPYAHPPTGHYNLQPPQELTYASFCKETSMNDSKSIYKAIQYKPACLQYKPTQNVVNPNSNEDCLYLNVYTPETFPKVLRPVIVVIIGLFHQYGSANMPYFTVTPALVKSVDAVHVTFNYRLGPLSFSVLEDTNLTNFGILDQIALLKWVKNNIKKFGGDPQNIVLYGIGSGATYCLNHLASKNSDLFHKMWASSPGLILDRELKHLRGNAEVSAQSLLQKCKWNTCTNRILDFLDLTNKFIPGNFSTTASLPIIDDNVIKKNYWKLLGTQSKKIPLVLGINSNDAGILPRPSTLRLWHDDEYKLFVHNKVGNNSFLDLYSLDEDKSPENQYSRAVTDVRMTCPIIKLANQMKNDMNQLIYVYQVTGNHDFVDLYGLKFASYLPIHGWDSALYFGSYEIKQFQSWTSLAKATRKMRSYMREFAWSNTISEFHHWTKQDQYMNIIEQDGQVGPHQFFKQSECKFWQENGFDSVWRG